MKKTLVASLLCLTVLSIPSAVHADAPTYTFDSWALPVTTLSTFICYVEVDPGTVSVTGITDAVPGEGWVKDLGYVYNGKNFQIWSEEVGATPGGGAMTLTYSAPLTGQAVEMGCTVLPGPYVKVWNGTKQWVNAPISFPTPNTQTLEYFGYGETSGEASVAPGTSGENPAVTPEDNIVIFRYGHARPADQNTAPANATGISVAVGFAWDSNLLA
jgi:hypothetical protein